MSDPPKRTESTELTIVRPRNPLPPVSTMPGPTIEQLAEMEEAHRALLRSRETQMECPWCHEGLVSVEQHAEWLARYSELAFEQPPPSQPSEPPPPRAA